jgi:hypothetical protein
MGNSALTECFSIAQSEVVGFIEIGSNFKQNFGKILFLFFHGEKFCEYPLPGNFSLALSEVSWCLPYL